MSIAGFLKSFLGFGKSPWEESHSISKEAVIKPAISGAARNTYRITPNNCTDYENTFQRLIKEESMLFQEFQDPYCHVMILRANRNIS